ncbi:hypothetical protein CF326_g2412 [Tilletia indica]|nr:hypothetical protein CF326_g2412 [Tilletia indica]
MLMNNMLAVALATLSVALGTDALPSKSAAVASAASWSLVCSPLWTGSRLSIRELLTNAKTETVGSTSNHNSRDRLTVNTSNYPDWEFHTCKGPGIPSSKDGVVFGRLFDNGTGLCASLDNLPTGTDREVIWEKVCSADSKQAVKQLFSYSPSAKEILFAGDLPTFSDDKKGVYVIDIHTSYYIPKYPTREVAVRHVDTYSGKHYILKRVP